MPRWIRLLAPALMIAPTGCALRDYIWEPPVRPIPDAMSVRGLTSASPSELSPDLAAAHEKLRAGDVSAACKAYHKIADNTKNPPTVAEEARFFEAECLYKQDDWPKACDTYHKTLLDFPNGQYRAQCCRRMFDIANVWLDETRTEQARKEKKEGSFWEITPVVHFEKQKPFFDMEGRALQALEQVHLNDIGGPLADKALFLAGGIKFYREDYREADYYYTQLTEQHPNSPLAPKAIELAIISKHLSTGGADYDGRKVAEARQLVDTAMRAYPELAQSKSGFLERQLYSINYQQAEKDYNTALFYLRTGHPGSAYYYLEIVRRSYPGSKFANDATQKMLDIRRDVEAGKYDKKEKDYFEKLEEQWEGLFGKSEGGPGQPLAGTGAPPAGMNPGGMMPRR
ncbi:MAG: outer membrane protein assembly factor BamD [Gemmataceae bacterium]|nr:outer membrane protein assembly factor BamD [Gemmataceae bacterium]